MNVRQANITTNFRHATVTLEITDVLPKRKNKKKKDEKRKTKQEKKEKEAQEGNPPRDGPPSRRAKKLIFYI